MVEAVRLLHFGALCAWAGVVAVEGVLELGDRDDGKNATRLHYLIDLFVEGPLLAVVLITGIVLWSQASMSISSLLALKIGCGLVAIGANLLCVGFVVVRHRHRDDPVARRFWSRYVRGSILALPFALAAAYLGLRYFHR